VNRIGIFPKEIIMLRRWGLLLLGIGLFFGTLQPGTAADDAKPVRMLFVLGSPPFHDIRTLPPILEKAIQHAGGIQVTRLEPPKDKPPNDAAHLAQLVDIKRSDYDVLVFYTSGYKLDEAQEQAIEKFVDEGGGLVGLHGASGSFGNSKMWMRLLGGKFTGHIPGTHKLNIVIVDSKHPITAGIKDFSIIDEEYKHQLADVDRHLLARFRERPPASDQKANMDIIWTREVGKGRVFYSALGHGKEAWENPIWQKLIIQGILWAAGKPREINGLTEQQ
jgi:type 1 glutamine amidotransferase